MIGRQQNGWEVIQTEEHKIISAGEAVKRLNAAGFKDINYNRLCAGLRQGLYSFGIAILLKEYVYEIYPALLDKWIAERS